MQVISVNVGLPRDVEWEGQIVRTSIWKSPVEGPVLQAEIMRVSPANRARPSERVRMLPPSKASMTRST